MFQVLRHIIYAVEIELTDYNRSLIIHFKFQAMERIKRITI